MTGISKTWQVLHVSTCWKNDICISRYMILSVWVGAKRQFDRFAMILPHYLYVKKTYGFYTGKTNKAVYLEVHVQESLLVLVLFNSFIYSDAFYSLLSLN